MKKIILNFTIVLFFFLLGTSHLEAKHIVGGDMIYQCVEVNRTYNTVTFKIFFTIYRDTRGGGADFDNPAQIGIYKGSRGDWRYVNTINAYVQRVTPLDPDTGIPCLAVPTNIGVERGDYEFEITFDIDENESYLVSYRRCCRNNTINNIVDPQDEGALYSVTITPEAQVLCDNSPIFNEFPPIVICAGKEINFDHSARDVDPRDSTVYSFCTPFVGGGPLGTNPGENSAACDGISPDTRYCPPQFETVNFRNPYSENQPMGGDPLVQIDPVTGLITGVPTITGQFVVGICAKSYRDGELIAEIVRDFQFNVAVCDPLVSASIDYDELIGGDEYKIISCGDTDVDLNNTSTVERFIESYDWVFPVNNEDTLRFIQRDITAGFPGVGEYQGQLILNNESDFLECRDTADITVVIYPDITADFTTNYDKCKIEPVDFTDLSVADVGNVDLWEWSINGEIQSTMQNFTYQFLEAGEKLVQLKVTDQNECFDVIDTLIDYYPLPSELDFNPTKLVGCAPEEITFDNATTYINGDYDVLWDFGELGTTDEISPTVLFEEPGDYSVTLKVLSPVGCELEGNYSDLIRMKVGPVAGFSYNPEEVTSLDNIVSFTDESIDADDWIWEIGDDVVFSRNHTYTFIDTGLVSVKEIVRHVNGCTDTAFALIDVIPVPTYFMPNAFTPNNDGLNEEYIGKGYTDGFKSFTMQIYNRWGERVFESNDPVLGWNGHIDNGDQKCPAGTYVYKVNYVGPRNEKKELRGHVTLIR